MDASTASEIRAQSLQSFTNAGRNFDLLSNKAGDSSIFYGDVLKAAVVREMRELDTIESQANRNLLHPGAGATPVAGTP